MTSCAVYRMAEQVGGDIPAPPDLRQRIGVIKQPAHRHVPAAHTGVTNVVKIAERVRVMKRPMLAERLPVIASLDAVEHDEPAHVGAGEELALAVEVEAPHIAPALTEQLEPLAHRVIAPYALLKLDAADPGRDGTTLQAVEPAVGPPGERVRHRVGVFHAET